MTKDIYDNVLQFHQSPGPLNQNSIDVALKKKLWSVKKNKTELTVKKKKNKLGMSFDSDIDHSEKKEKTIE